MLLLRLFMFFKHATLSRRKPSGRKGAVAKTNGLLKECKDFSKQTLSRGKMRFYAHPRLDFVLQKANEI